MARFGLVISIKTARKVLIRASMADLETQVQKLSAAIAGLESQRKGLGDAVVDPAIAALREQLAQLEASPASTADTDRIAAEFASGLLAESQHPLPETLLNAIRKACDEWQNGVQENATLDL